MSTRWPSRLSFGLLLMAVAANSACVRRCGDGTPPPCAPATARVAVLPFIVIGDTADSTASVRFSQRVAESLERAPRMEVTPWALAHAAQRSGSPDWWRRTAKPLGVRYLVSVGAGARGATLRLNWELTDARDGRTLLSGYRDLASDSLAAAADRVAQSVVLQLRLTPPEAPGASWKPTKLLWVYLALVAVTAGLATRRRTSWLSLAGVAVLPPYFLWVVWDAWRSPSAGGTQKAAAKDVAAKVDALIFKFKDPDRMQHEPSVRKMIALGMPAVEPLIRYLCHDDEWARLMAAAALGKMKDLRALEPLRNALGDPDQGVRHMATLALRELSAECEVPRVIQQLRSLRASIHQLRRSSPDGVLTVGPGVGQAHENIEIICRNLDEAVACLETEHDPAGRPITRAEIAAGLRSLARAARRPASMALLTMVLGEDAALTLERRLAELEHTADTIGGASASA